MLKQKHIINTFLVTVALLLFSCEEPFKPDIDITGYESLLVVDGLITDDEGPFRVQRAQRPRSVSSHFDQADRGGRGMRSPRLLDGD